MLRDRTYASSASAIVVSRAAFERAGGWTDVFPCEDTDLFLRAGTARTAIQILSPETALKRGHANNYSHDVVAMTNGLLKVLASERAGRYRQESRWARYCFIGGPAFFWVKKCLSVRAYGISARLAISSWPMIAAAVLHRVVSACGRRSTIQDLNLQDD